MPQPRNGDGAQVIVFRPPPLGRIAEESVRPDRAERGRILLFTGVRYERLDEDRFRALTWPAWDAEQAELA